VTVLVLHHRGSLAGSPYDRWLAGHDVVLLCSREGLDLIGEELPAVHGYRHIEAVTGYETAGRVEARVLELAAVHPIEYLVNCQEFDLERAAQLREILGLPGQRLDGAEAFRNKLSMKDTLSAAGIPVAPYQAVECETDLVAFAAEHGFPVVVKPRNGAGSVGVRIIRDDNGLTGFELEGELRSNLMVEAFVEGSMCHVDGLVVDGRLVFAWPSEYLFVEADFATDRAGRRDVALDRDDPLTGRLLTFTDEVLAAMPSPRTFAFHAEVFVRPDGSFVVCEVACRTGGAAIREVLRALFDVDINEWWMRGEVGLPLPASRLSPRRAAGQVFFTRRPGVVRAVPGEPPFPWLTKATVMVRPGQVGRTAAYTSDAMAFFIVTGENRAQVERRLRKVEKWFLTALHLDPPNALKGSFRALPRHRGEAGEREAGGVVVAGGGIAGLAAGIALAKAGVPVTVVERAPELLAVGSGLVLAPNGVAALDALDPDVGVAVREAGHVAEPGQTRPWLDRTGRLRSAEPIGELLTRWGTPQVSVRRSALQAILLDAARAAGVTIRTGASVTNFTDHGDHVDVHLDDGHTLTAGALLGADGVRSTVRAQLLADGPPRYCGYTSVRGEATAPPGLPYGFVAADENTHLFAAPIGPGRIYWAAKFDAPQGEWPAKTQEQARVELLDLIDGWDERIVATVGQEGPLVLTDVLDRDPVPQWTINRVTLLGDAAHPMSPAVGQGVSLAVEDAVVLAECLHDDMPAALASYETTRAPRAEFVVGRSRQGRTVVAGGDDQVYAWRPAA